MQHKTQLGPVEGHWMTVLNLVESTDDGNSYYCLLCISNGNQRTRSKFRCSRTSSNLYTHFKLVHNDVYNIVSPIIHSREKNKKRKVVSTTIAESLAISNKRKIIESLLRFFSSPDVSSRLFDNKLFLKFVQCINPTVEIPTRKTLNSMLWDKFNETIAQISACVRDAEFYSVIFDSWSSIHNESVLGFSVCFLNKCLTLETSCIGNYGMSNTHTARDVSDFIAKMVRERCSGRYPCFFVSDSASVNKAAVRQYMNDNGDSFWFPCAVHFAQLAMREAVSKYYNSTELSSEEETVSDTSGDEDDKLVSKLSMIPLSNQFQRVLKTSRAIKTALRRSHQRASLFHRCQSHFGIERGIVGDTKTRFDSTLDMLESILHNRRPLERMRELTLSAYTIWPSVFHLRADDFTMIDNVVSVLKPVKDVTNFLSTKTSWSGDVVPMFSSAHDAVSRLQVSSNASSLKTYLLNELSSRIQMLLGTDCCLPISGGSKMLKEPANEYVVASFLNPRFSSAMENVYGYSERSVLCEIIRLFDIHCERRKNDSLANTANIEKGSYIANSCKVVESCEIIRQSSINCKNQSCNGCQADYFGQSKRIDESRRNVAESGQKLVKSGQEVLTSSVNRFSHVDKLEWEHLPLADAWAVRSETKSSKSSESRLSIRMRIKKEMSQYRLDINGKRFDAEKARQFWLDKYNEGKYTILSQVARLLLTVPASAIHQERVFSELKRRGNSLRNRVKVETLDRDAVVYAWYDKINQN